MPALVQMRINEGLYRRDPTETSLGRKLLSESVRLIDELGMEGFTFKKLAKESSSTEASVYRYFTSKQQLLNYLFAWYWSWLEYRLTQRTANISDPQRRLKLAIGVLAESLEDDPGTPYINEALLHKIVTTESDRSLLTHNLRKGGPPQNLEAYASLCSTLARYIQAMSPEFPYPQALTVTLLAATHRQRFYAEYFPDVTEVKSHDSDPQALAQFLELLVFSVLNG